MYLGIDLGTSNSAVAAIDSATLRVFKTSKGSDYLPSVIYMDRRGNRFYGEHAYSQLAMSPENTASGFKRLIGTDTPFLFKAAQQQLTPEQCSAEILKQLIGQASSEAAQTEFEGTVITIPAAFNQLQSEATVNAARLAGLAPVALLQEPVAAAMAAMAGGKTRNGQFLIYDLGGGTFDLALVQSHNGIINILAHEGINMCGGRDMDKVLLNAVVRPWLLENFDLPVDFQKASEGQRLVRIAQFAAERAKIELSTGEKATIAATEEELRVRDQSGEEIYLQIEITRRQMELLIDEQVTETISLTRKILSDNGYTQDDIDRIVFIGGPTKMPGIRDRVPREMGIPGDLDIDPMTAVALGAAIYAESRTWEQQGSARKAAKGFAHSTGELRLQFDYTERTEGELAKIKISFEGQHRTEDHELQLTTQTGWTSGRMRLVDNLMVEVPLPDYGDNCIHLEVFDGAGKLVPGATQALHVTRVLSSAAAIPATQTVAVKVVEREGSSRSVLTTLIAKGTPLPASGTQSFRAARPIRSGENDYIELELFQDEGVPEVELNLPIGSFKITGDDLPENEQIRVGDEVKVKWFMSDSGLLSAGIELPKIGQTFHSPKFYCTDGGKRAYSLEEGTLFCEEVARSAREELDTLEEALGQSASIEVQRIRGDINKQLDALQQASSGEDTRLATESLRRIRQQISRIAHAPANKKLVLTRQLTQLQAGYNELVRPNMDEDLNALFDHHSAHAQTALAKGDERSLRNMEVHIEEMKGIRMAYLLQDVRFLLAVLSDRNEKRYLASDKVEFDRLLRQARTAVETEDIDSLRETIFRIDAILFRTTSMNNDLGRVASLMRA